MSDLNQFRKDLETLKTRRTEVNVRLGAAVNKAKEYKDQLALLGYADLNAAKEDYAKRVSDADAKHQRVLSYIRQIEEAESQIPSKDAVLKRLRSSVVAPVEDSSECAVESSVSIDKQETSFDDPTSLL